MTHHQTTLRPVKLVENKPHTQPKESLIYNTIILATTFSDSVSYSNPDDKEFINLKVAKRNIIKAMF